MQFIVFVVIVGFAWWWIKNKDKKSLQDHFDQMKNSADINILHFILHGTIDKLTAEERIEFRDQMGMVKRQLDQVKGKTTDIENLVFGSNNKTVTKVLTLVKDNASAAPTQYNRVVPKDAFIEFLARNI